jgi:rhodanese-related sulfurtransferase
MTAPFYNRAPFAPAGAFVQFFIDNALLIAVAFVSGGMLLWPLLRSRAAGPALTTLQATQLINGTHAQVVDVRDAAEFARARAEGAEEGPAGDRPVQRRQHRRPRRRAAARRGSGRGLRAGGRPERLARGRPAAEGLTGIPPNPTPERP